jgi:hypothetical protein
MDLDRAQPGRSHLGEIVGDPDADTENHSDDRNGNDIHQHALPIINRFIFDPRSYRARSSINSLP